MDLLLGVIVNGLSVGSVYALIALSIVVLFKATGTFNFAIAGFVLVGGLLVADLHDTIGFLPSLVVAAVVVGVGGVLVERGFLSRITGTHRTMYAAILLLSIDSFLHAEVRRNMVAADTKPLGDPWGSSTVEILGTTVASARLVAILVAVIALTLFFGALRYSNWGVAMRATSDDPTTAALMGVRLSRVRASAWLVAGVFATLAAVFLSSYPSPGFDQSVGVVALRALPAVIIGGLDSPKGAVLGGLLIGLFESFVTGYDTHLSFLGTGLASLAPYVLLLAVLLWRPSGLFGTKEIARV